MRATKDKERGKITKILNVSTTVTVHICTVTIALMHNFTPTDVGVFLVRMCKMKGFLYFA